MNRLIHIFVFCLLSIANGFLFAAAAAEATIPPELVGDWRAKTSKEEMFLCLRSDGLAMMGSSIGAAGLAIYAPKNLTLTVSLRHDETGAEIARMILSYDPKVLTLTNAKLISYYDPMNPLPKPREENPKLTFRRLSNQPPEFLKSLDRKKILKISP